MGIFLVTCFVFAKDVKLALLGIFRDDPLRLFGINHVQYFVSATSKRQLLRAENGPKQAHLFHRVIMSPCWARFTTGIPGA